MTDKPHSKEWIKVMAVITSLGAIIGVGTVFFRFVEGWSWVDSYFFSVITLSTVGYGDLSPDTTLGKIGATIFIFAGLGVFAYAIQLFGLMAIRRQERKLTAKHGEHEEKAPLDWPGPRL